MTNDLTFSAKMVHPHTGQQAYLAGTGAMDAPLIAYKRKSYSYGVFIVTLIH